MLKGNNAGPSASLADQLLLLMGGTKRMDDDEFLSSVAKGAAEPLVNPQAAKQPVMGHDLEYK